MNMNAMLTLAEQIIKECKGCGRNSPATQKIVDALTAEEKSMLEFAMMYKLGIAIVD